MAFVHALRRCAFRLGYQLYSTRLGYYLFHSVSSDYKPHTTCTILSSGELNVLPVPFAKDNYAYLLWRTGHESEATVVDVGDNVAVQSTLQTVKDIQVQSILTTHKHWDHSGGVSALRKWLENRGITHQAFIGTGDATAGHDRQVCDKDLIELRSGIKIKVLSTPCHTSGHVVYYVYPIGGNGILFSGDTLFVGGCGRFFEGSAEDMLRAFKKIDDLPEDTLIFCGHDYTVSNLKFAVEVNESEKCIEERLAWAIKKREACLPTVPTTIAEERQTNLFYRCVRLGEEKGVTALRHLRQLKDSWR